MDIYRNNNKEFEDMHINQILGEIAEQLIDISSSLRSIKESFKETNTISEFRMKGGQNVKK